MNNMNFISLKTRSVYTLMVLSLFAISFTIISDTQTAYGIEISLPQNAVTENDFDNIGILDIKTTENGIYLLYWNSDDNDNLKFTSSVDDGATWSEPVFIYDGLDSIFTETTSEHIFINDNGDIGIGWEQESEPILLFFALSTDNGLTFTVFEEIFESEFNNSENIIAWSGDGQNLALTVSDEEIQGVIVSNDFGISWTDIVLQSNDDDGITNQNSGSIVVNGMNMYAIWNGQDDDSHIYFSKSNDAGNTWDISTQISASAISEDNTRLLVSDDGTKVLISWIGDSQELMQVVSTDGGDTFGSLKILDGLICDNEFDVDNLGDDIIFMCKGISESKRYALVSNDFGQTYSTEFTIIDGSDVGIINSNFAENIGIGDNLYSLWEDTINPIKSKFLSFSQDKGQIFNFESLPGVDDVTIQNGIFSRQIVSDNTWYWFVQSSPTTIDFVKVIAEFPVDHYLGYDVKDKAKHHDEDKHHDHHEKLTVNLVDEFAGDVDYEVKKLKYLFNPAQVTGGEEIGSEESHLVSYNIKKIKGEPKFEKIKDISITNQFGDLIVDIKKPKHLLVPSAKSHDPVPAELEKIVINHFKCYDAKESKKTPKFEKRTIDLDDQFGSVTMKVHKIKSLCSPVDKNSEGVVNEENYLMCYDLKKIKGESKFQKINVFTNNQFGSEELEAKKQKQLCVPSTIVLSDPS
jgi:hypothetical protein